MINQIHLTQGKGELWEKAVEINKIAEKLKKNVQKKIKTYGSRADGLLDSVEFILSRKF